MTLRYHHSYSPLYTTLRQPSSTINTTIVDYFIASTPDMIIPILTRNAPVLSLKTGTRIWRDFFQITLSSLPSFIIYAIIQDGLFELPTIPKDGPFEISLDGGGGGGIFDFDFVITVG